MPRTVTELMHLYPDPADRIRFVNQMVRDSGTCNLHPAFSAQRLADLLAVHGRYPTVQDMADDLGPSYSRMRALLARARARGRLSGVAVLTAADGAA